MLLRIALVILFTLSLSLCLSPSLADLYYKRQLIEEENRYLKELNKNLEEINKLQKKLDKKQKSINEDFKAINKTLFGQI
jgi:uncharacterized protein YPO0396